MKKFIVIAVLALSCSPKKPPCAPEEREALFEAYAVAAEHLIESGACKDYAGKPVEQCPAYAALEAHFTAAEFALCK